MIHKLRQVIIVTHISFHYFAPEKWQQPSLIMATDNESMYNI